MTHLSITIYGRVQGVFFRDHARRKALELGITGWVRNEPDGSVRIEAEGKEAVLQEFLKWCKEGSPRAQVERVVFEWKKELEGYESFEIRAWA